MKYIIKIITIFSVFLFVCSNVYTQEKLIYQKPPKEILELVDVEFPPQVLLDDKEEFMILLQRNQFKSIEELSQKELRLAGLRIDPKTNIGSRTNYYNNIKIKNIKGKLSKAVQVKGMPENGRFTNFTWSPNQQKMAVTNTTFHGVELWVIDLETASMKKLIEAGINANMRDVINWFEDGKSLLLKMISKNRKTLIDTENAIPSGPTISVSDGKKAQNRTYQDLLKNKNDELNFEQLALSEIYKVNLNGSKKIWLKADMYRSINFSPDGNYVLVKTVEKPFSYLVPYYRFPSETVIYSKDGKKIETIVKVPLIEDLPKGFMAARKGRRNIEWRSDKPSTLIFSKVLDGGDPKNKVDFRDEVFQLDAPFSGKAESIFKTINRYRGIEWGNDSTAIVFDYWWNTRNVKAYLFNPSDLSKKPVILWDRNYQDRYNAPGQFVTRRNHYGSHVLELKGDNCFLIGEGFTDKGQFPFLDTLNLKTKKTSRIYQSKYTDKLEAISNYDLKKDQILVRIESKTEYPNYYFRSLKKNELKQLTFFENPFKSIQDIEKEVITYKRDDGLELSGTLYLPFGYNKSKKKKMPLILWAYPKEYKDKSSASQKTQNPNKFIFPFWSKPIYWVTQGYVILDRATFPIVGEGDEEPNDSFRKQLIANAKAAIDAVDRLGYIDRKKVAVGGHSYGAFMVANLLSHSQLFAAGIARSGAYNRTMTPFGFQSEERSYWEAPDVYNNMSPFMHADKMKTPLLLVHGAADNNSGTYPLQSERYFNALKGLGATVRLVMFPKESHSYRSKESILHLLWEQHEWFEKYLK